MNLDLAKLAKKLAEGARARVRDEAKRIDAIIASHKMDRGTDCGPRHRFGNSNDEGYREIVSINNGSCLWFDPIPAWAAPLHASCENNKPGNICQPALSDAQLSA